MKNVVLALLVFALSTGCSKFVSKTMIQERMADTDNPYEIPIFYGENEVKGNFIVSGYFEWRKRITPFGVLSHRKKIGHKVLKKTTGFIKSGKMMKPDGIIINDFRHATYIQKVGEGELGKVNIPGFSSPVQGPSKPDSYESEFTNPNEAEFPRIRIGGGLLYSSSFIRNWGLQARGAYNLADQGIDNFEVAAQFGLFFPTSNRSKLQLDLLGRYMFDLQARGVSPLALRLYPQAGITFGLNSSRLFNNERRTSTDGGILLGVGGEYRLQEKLSAFLEASFVSSSDGLPGYIIGAGIYSWL